MPTHTFDLDAGALCLDFANTVDWHASDHPDDKLHDYTDLIAWAEAAAILLPDRADRSRQMAQKQPKMAGAAFDRAIRLREAIYRLFVDVSERGAFHDEDLALLNETLSESLAHLQVVPSSTGFDWGWAESSMGFDQILWPVARSAGELLISDKLERVRQCADNRGCGYLFVDTSRNRSRRWCSMESCGNRAKAHRHYQRQQKAQ
jgi:predicted RNA-binding Zn ribbon-like protein